MVFPTNPLLQLQICAPLLVRVATLPQQMAVSADAVTLHCAQVIFGRRNSVLNKNSIHFNKLGFFILVAFFWFINNKTNVFRRYHHHGNGICVFKYVFTELDLYNPCRERVTGGIKFSSRTLSDKKFLLLKQFQGLFRDLFVPNFLKYILRHRLFLLR